MKFIRSVNPATPHGNSIIWRYMSLDRFVGLMESGNLFFTKATKFSDKHEFSIPAATAESIKRNHGEALLSQKTAEMKAFRDSTFVSCWTMKRQESYVLWKIYLRDSNYGVAIKTTVSKLRGNLEAENRGKQLDMHHVEVQYEDSFAPEKLDGPKIASSKRKSYSDEDEVRLFFTGLEHLPDPPESQNGVPLKVVPARVIDEVYLSPFGGNYFTEVFSNMLTKRYGWLSNKVRQSEILDR